MRTGGGGNSWGEVQPIHYCVAAGPFADSPRFLHADFADAIRAAAVALPSDPVQLTRFADEKMPPL